MPGLADLLAQALSVSPAYQRQTDARDANTYYPMRLQEMLQGMGNSQMLGGMNYAAPNLYPQDVPPPIHPPIPQVGTPSMQIPGYGGRR